MQHFLLILSSFLTTAFEFQDFLLALIDHNRPDEDCVDVAKAKEDAATLRQKFQEMRKRYGPYKRCKRCSSGGYDLHADCSRFCRDYKPLPLAVHDILASRSWIHLKETFKIYKKEYKKSFAADIHPPKSVHPTSTPDWTDYTNALLAIYDYAYNSNTFFAKALKRDIFLCEDDLRGWSYAYSVARIFVWRSENDLGDIAKAFRRKYSKSLVGYVQKWLSWDAKHALMGILQ